MKNFSTDPLTVGIAGTGAMGRGIAQMMAQAGCEVLLFDVQAGAALKAQEYVAAMLGKLVEMGERTYKLEIAAGVKVDVLKSSIAGKDGTDVSPADKK